MIKSQLRKLTLGLALSIGVLALVACGSTRPKPAELPPIVGQKPVETLWSFQLGEVKLSLVPSFTAQGQVVLATSDGDLLTLQMSDGKLLQKVSLNQRLSAGVGSDGKRHAVVTRDNQLITVADGKEAWRQTLSAQVFTPPLVAGERVFVLLADRTVQAFDGATGRLLWTQSRAGEPLVLSQSGTLMPFGNTLVAGLSGRLTGFDPTTGRIVWEAPMASPRGLNDLERLVDVVGLSILSGAHMTLFPRVRDLLRESGRDDILLTGGGIIPKEDMDTLQANGVARLFGPGTSTQELVDYIRAWFATRVQQDA